MRKFILAIAAWIIASSAQAHVSAVKYPEIGSLRDVAQQAAFGIFQTYRTDQIFYNIVADSGNPNSCTQTGGGQQVTTNVTTAVGSANVTVFSNTFVAGDVGKYFTSGSINFGGGYRKIQSVGAWNGSQQVIVLDGNLFSNITNSSVTITYGFDDSPDFKVFNTWARANQGTNKQVVLTIPSGKTCWFGSVQTISGNINNSYFAGINNLLVEGTGATVSCINGSCFPFAGNGMLNAPLTQVSGKSARLKSVSAGASTVELTAASYSGGYISRFNVGDWIMLSGIEVQALWQSDFGQPPNFQFFNWRQITAICNNTGPCTGTATMTLDRPLTVSLLDTWPQWYDGGTTGADMGGPATAFLMASSWNTIVKWRGVTIDAGQTLAWGRNVTFENVTWLGANGTVPSQNEAFTAINCTYSGGTGWEVDKDVDVLTITGGSFSRIDFQSSSVNSLVMSNATIGSLVGTPKSTQITDTTFTSSLRPGAWTNGSSTGPFVCTRCDVASFQWSNQGLVQQVGTPFSMSSGVITTANTDQTGPNGPPHRVMVPSGNVFYFINSGTSTIGLFQSNAQTQDATNSYVQTNEAGGFPTFSGYVNAMQTHPATQYTCTDCTGDESFVATSTNNGCPAGGPLGQCSSYKNITLTAPFVIRGKLQVKGKISTFTIDIKTAATAAGAVTLYTTGSGGSVNTVRQSTWTTFAWGPAIDAKTVGKRVYTYPTGWTCDTGSGPVPGGCGSDSLGTNPPEQVWIGNGFDFGTNTSFITPPIFDISTTTNQGVVP